MGRLSSFFIVFACGVEVSLFKFALSNTFITPSDVSCAGSSPLLVEIDLSALNSDMVSVFDQMTTTHHPPVVAEQIYNVQMVPLGSPV
jgi:hypothetical protein